MYVWLLDEDKRFLATAAALLQLEGHVVLPFTEPEALLARAESKRARKPDVVVLEKVLAGQPVGLRLALDLRRYASLADTAIIIYSLHDPEPSDLFWCALAGVPHYLKGDDSVGDLVSIVNKATSPGSALAPRDLVLRLPARLYALAVLMRHIDNHPSLLELFHDMLIDYVARHPGRITRALEQASPDDLLDAPTLDILRTTLASADKERLLAVAEL